MLLLASLLVLVTRPVLPQTKLNGPLPREVIGALANFERAPDGATFAYVSSERFEGVWELFTTPADGSTAPTVVSGTLVAGGGVGLPSGTFDSFAYGPDGTWLAFVADATVDGRYELFRVPVDGSAAPTLLSGALVNGGDVTHLQIAPDGNSIVFLADAEVDERFELYRVPADGSAARTKLSPPLTSNGDVTSFLVGPQSLRAYFLADAALDGVNELYSAPVDGSLPAVRLNDALAAGRSVLDLQLAPDETRVVYRADAVSDDVFELFSVSRDRSSAPTKLTPTPVAGGDIASDYAIDPASLRVAYRADQDTDNVLELYSAPLDGSAAAVKLHPGASSVTMFHFTVDGTQVLFAGKVGSVRGLFRVPATGGTPVLRSADLLLSASVVEDVGAILTSADGLTCVYVQRVTTQILPFGGSALYENLFAVGIASGAPLQLTHDAHESLGSYDVVWKPALTDDGTTALYLRFGNQANALSAVPLDASSAPLLLDTSYPLDSFVLDGERVAHLEGRRLTSTALDGSGSIYLSAPPLLGDVVGDVAGYQATPDGLQVVYREASEGQLYVVGVGGSTLPRTLEGPDLPRYALNSPIYSDDSQRIAYLGQSLMDATIGLLSAHLRSSADPVRLDVPAVNGPTVATHPALQPRFTHDGTRMVYAAGASSGSTGFYALYVVPSDGGLPPTRLNGTGADTYLWDGGDSSQNVERAFALTPDGERVVYSASSSGFRHSLFSVPLDQSTAPVQLFAPTPSLSSVFGNWELSPDGTRVVYLADQDVHLRSELYSAPVDGSAPAIKLNPPLVSGGSVGFYGEGAGLLPSVRLTPDSTRAVYRADQETNDVNELYSVPLDGSAAAVKVSGPMTAGGDVRSGFQLDPTGTFVFYTADATTNETYELFVAPVDGGAAPTKLSGTLVAGGDVSVVEAREGLVHVGSGRAVYVADALTDDVFELFSVPVDGSAPPLRLNAPLVSGGDVSSEQVLILADGETVLYVADAATNDTFELWRVPIDGSAAPVRVNRPLPPGGDVQLDTRATARGNRIFYRADQDVDEVFELFTVRLEPRTPHGPAASAAPTRTATRQL